MLAAFVTIKVKEGREADFEAAAKQLVAAVNKSEPGCKLYALAKGEAPLTYYFMERYVDQAAIEAHRATEHMKTYGPKMGECMDGRPQITRLQEVS